MTLVYTMLPLYLVTERGLGNDYANAVLSLSRISGLFMTFIAGWMTDRIGERKVISATLILVGISTILIGTLSGVWLVVIIFIQAALSACYFPAGFSKFFQAQLFFVKRLEAEITFLNNL